MVTFERAPTDGDWVIGLDDLETLGDKLLAEQPDVIDRIVARHQPRRPRHPDLHLRHHGPAQGRPAAPRLAGPTRAPPSRRYDILAEDDLQFLWLPLAHSFGKVLLSAQLAVGFPTAVDGRVDKIIDNLAVVKPTFMGAAPRIFEKAHGRIVTMQQAEGGLKEKIFNRAFAVGLEVRRAPARGQAGAVPARACSTRVFDKLVFSKIRERFGGRVRFFISGAAALNREIAEWFHAAGILILEGYGLTETSAGAFVNHPDDYKFGTVGPGVPGRARSRSPTTARS